MMCADIMMRCLALPVCSDGIRKARTAIIRNTYPELKTTTIPTWLHWFPESRYGRLKWSSPMLQNMDLIDEHGVRCQFEFMFLSLDGEGDESKLLSLELTFVWVNELREIKQNIFEAACSRVGRYPAKQDFSAEVTRKLELQEQRKEKDRLAPNEEGDIVFTVNADTNAPNETHWIVQKWFKEKQDEEAVVTHPRWMIIKQPPPLLYIKDTETYIRNPAAENVENHLKGIAYYLDMIETTSPEWFNVMIMNKFGAAFNGLPIYKDYNSTLHRLPWDLKPVLGEPLYLGFDFGRTPACIAAQLIDGQFRVLDEFVAAKDNKLESIGLNSFLEAFVLPALCSDKYKDFKKIISIGDPAGVRRNDTDEQYCISMLNEAGLNARPCYTQAEKKRIEGITHYLKKIINGKPAFALSKSCIMLHEGLAGGYQYSSYTQRSTGTTVYDEHPAKNRYSHAVEALQYIAVQTIYEGQQEVLDEDKGFYSPSGHFIQP